MFEILKSPDDGSKASLCLLFRRGTILDVRGQATSVFAVSAEPDGDNFDNNSSSSKFWPHSYQSYRRLR